MNDGFIEVPDFYPRLRLEPGRELEMFPARLRDVVELREELSAAPWPQHRRALDDLYRRHGSSPGQASFAQVIAAEEKATDSGDEGIRLHEIGEAISALERPASANYAPRAVEFDAAYYGYGTDSDYKNWMLWATHSRIDALFELALDECRRSGGMAIPHHWTPSTLSISASNELWKCKFRDGHAFYMGSVAPRFDDLVLFAGTLLVSEPSPWLLEGNGSGWDQIEANRVTAFHAWDAAMSYHANGHYAEAIDTLRVLQLVGCHHPRIELITREFLDSQNIGVRHAVAGMLLAHAYTAGDPTLSPALMSDVAKSACVETERAIAENLIYTLRLQGGEPCFDALLEVARKAETPYARDAASRALAWVPRVPQRLGRLAELARSRDRRTSRAAVNGLKEAKMHGLFSREGEFVSAMERSVHDALRRFLKSGGLDNDAEQALEYAFGNGFVRLEIEGVPGTSGCIVTVMTCDEVPLHVEQEYTLECSGLLNLLPSVDVPGADLSSEELERERALRQLLGASAVRLEGRQRALIGQALMTADQSDRKTIAAYVDKFLEQQVQGSGVPVLILSLDRESQLDALLLVLEALPDLAASIRHVLVKGPETGTRTRLDAFRAQCPNLASYWGYVHGFPEDGSAHMERFIEIIDEPGRFDRERLVGLDGVEDIVLWSAVGGYQPPN